MTRIEEQNWIDNLTLDEIKEILNLDELEILDIFKEYEIHPEDNVGLKDYLLTEYDNDLRKYYWKEN